MRAYELMVIVDADVDDAGQKAVLERIGELIEADGGKIATTDLWGRAALRLPHQQEARGHLLGVRDRDPGVEPRHELDRFLRLADDVVRHKIIRLPEGEATKRGLLGEPAAS